MREFLTIIFEVSDYDLTQLIWVFSGLMAMQCAAI